MERRHITFLLLAASLLLTFNLFNRMNPPEPKPELDQEEIVEFDEKANTPADNKPGEGAEDVEEDKVVYDRTFATLGSIDPESGYRMLVTVDSRGGSIHRVELSNPNFQSYEHDDDGGYLGQLAFDETDGKGVKIHVVGPGTPAAEATSKTEGAANGLKPGDQIVSVDGTSVTDIATFREALKKTRPGQEIEVVVDRPGEGDAAATKVTFAIQLRKHPIEVIKPDTSTIDGPDGLPKVVDHPPAFLTSLAQVGALSSRDGLKEIKGLPSLIDSNWKVTQVSESEVHLEMTLFPSDLKQLGENRKLRLVKKFSLPKVTEEQKSVEGFDIQYQLELHNESEDSLPVAYRQFGPTGLPLEGWWYAHKISRGWGTAGIRDVTWESLDTGKFTLFTVHSLVDQAQKEGADPWTPLMAAGSTDKTKYAGVDAQYFNCSLLLDYEGSDPKFQMSKAAGAPIAPINEAYEPKTDCSFLLQSQAYPLGAGQTVTQKFRIFAGPKETSVLQHYGLGNVEYYGWFSAVSWLLLQVLHGLYAVLGNYGLAIIVLTLAVRGAMHPISRKQAKNMQIQAALAPEIKRISDQYKDDPEGRLKAQQDLFKKHKFNPVGGCLMMFIQLPIFLGLYRALAVDFQLRQAPLIPGISWCSNLAAPDQLLFWGDWMPEFISRPTGFLSLGPYLNILPLVTVALFLVQQKLFMPPPQDEQQEVQQRIMTFMMIFMGIMFFKVPSGLCIYFITSSIWGILERKLLPKPKNIPTVIEAKKEDIKQPRIRQSKKKR
ncbi:YidC/Oxa1 family insertase periplasmic-domain containing protein [Bremerella cremea]|uniref:YidC/Oxa1 family insertase periplasmic-domain containing protein n=1 Tax=Bremerella cremea TaxID=1031537 RepID=UPI0031F1052C